VGRSRKPALRDEGVNRHRVNRANHMWYIGTSRSRAMSRARARMLVTVREHESWPRVRLVCMRMRCADDKLQGAVYRYRVPVKRHRGSRVPVKRHRGEPGHTRDTRNTRTHKGTQTTQTKLTTIETHQQHTPRTSARRPKPRPTQQPQARGRPLPAADSEEAAPSEPDPASTRCPRAPPRAPARMSKAVGEMKARAADA